MTSKSCSHFSECTPLLGAVLNLRGDALGTGGATTDASILLAEPLLDWALVVDDSALVATIFVEVAAASPRLVFLPRSVARLPKVVKGA